MKNLTNRFLAGSLLFITITACGSESKEPASQPGAEIIQKYKFHIVGEPVSSNLTLPLQFNDANWGIKEDVCKQTGYSLIPYAGESISVFKYIITEKSNSEPLYLWILVKDKTCICGFLSVREDSNSAPGVFPLTTSGQ